MTFQSDEQKYQILAKLSLIALYILLAYDVAALAAGYLLAQTSSTTIAGNTIVRDAVFAVAVADLVAIYLVKKSMLNKIAKSQSNANVPNAIEEYKKLLNITLVIALMCAGALVLARVDRLVFGAADPKFGACVSIFRIVQDPRLNHRMALSSGILLDDCAEIMQEFFKKKRKGA